MQNIPEGLIPYNHEKYLTGKFIAETRGGFRPKKVENMKGANQPLVYIDDENDICSCNEDGGLEAKWYRYTQQRPLPTPKDGEEVASGV